MFIYFLRKIFCFLANLVCLGGSPDNNCGLVSIQQASFPTHSFAFDQRCGEQGLGYQLANQTDICYKFHTQAAIWTDANRTCVEEGGRLAVHDSQEKTKILTALYQKVPQSSIVNADLPYYAAIGLHWDDTWKTSDGQTFDLGYAELTPKPEEVDDSTYGYLAIFGWVYSFANGYKVPFICEKAPAQML